jgi:UDP-hydrolysing UDP-N-acetyl-D-glucosamine 2-epimerase
MKTIAVPLTNRTNYSKLKPVLHALRDTEQVDLRLVLSSTILLEKYGSAYADILADGFPIDRRIDCVLMNDSHESMAKTAGMSMVEHATYFGALKPHILLAVGDRFDMLGPVASASMMNIPIAHIQGGEVSGTIDNVIRDVFTNFATLHFVATEQSAQNLRRFGISAEQVFNTGCPAVEYISNIDVGNGFDAMRLNKTFKNTIDISPDEPYLLVMVHPDTTNSEDVDMGAVLNGVARTGHKALIFYPNVDAHNSSIVSSIAQYKNNPKFFMIRHMPLEGFVHAMAHCRCMIGNSSAGIREAASFGVPVINIGSRQANRERNRNVIDIGTDYSLLDQKLTQYADHRFERENIYHKPRCSQMIAAEILRFCTAKETTHGR